MVLVTCIEDIFTLIKISVGGGGPSPSDHANSGTKGFSTCRNCHGRRCWGFYTWKVSSCHGEHGEYVGLTGARLDGAEMLACGLATHFVHLNRMSLLEESLKKVDTSDPFEVCGIIDQFSQQPSLKESSTLNRLEVINKCFSERTVEEIISALNRKLQVRLMDG